jgi:drug/metabolite transporter (DMT)-like permease
MKWHRTPLELLPWQLLVGAFPMLITAYLYQPIRVIEWNPTSIFCLLFTSIFATGFAYWCTLVISKELPSTTVSLCYLAVPVAGLIFSAILLHEKMTSIIVISMLLILSGIASIVFDTSSNDIS